MARADKVTAVAELTGRFRDSDSVVLTEYHGLTVSQLSELRSSLGEHATFSVVKNTLTKIAVSEAGLEAELASLLTGPSAIAFVEGDMVEAAKGRYVKKATITTTMGPGIPVDPNKTRNLVEDEEPAAV